MRLVIEDKALVRCELADDEQEVEVLIPDEVDVICNGAFDGVGDRISCLDMPRGLRQVGAEAFAGLGRVGELIAYSYDDEDCVASLRAATGTPSPATSSTCAMVRAGITLTSALWRTTPRGI